LKKIKLYRLFRFLSFKKVWNAFLVLVSYQLSNIFKRPMQWGKPISISVEPTTSCNLRCPECPSGLRSFTRSIGMLKIDSFKKIIQEVKKTTAYLTFYFQGEPYLNPDFLKMVQIADEADIFTSTSTNAHYLTPQVAEATVKSGLKRIIISIDGTTQEVYQQYRVGGDLQKVIDGTKNIIAARKQLKSNFPKIIFQFLVVKPNEFQIEEIKKLGNELGVDDVIFKTAQIYNYQQGSPLIPENNKYSRYKKTRDNTYQIKNKLENKCWKLWHSCVITWDGRVLPCCFDKDGLFSMGNILQDNFDKIWQGETYKHFRKAILKSRKNISICQNCTEGLKVWVE